MKHAKVTCQGIGCVIHVTHRLPHSLKKNVLFIVKQNDIPHKPAGDNTLYIDGLWMVSKFFGIYYVWLFLNKFS